MDINLELYRVFYIVAKTKNMTKAAEELMVSQPAVTKSIKLLESQLGGTLFLRSNKGLELTEEGKNFYKKVAPALALIRDAENSFGEYKDLKIGEIKIGISSTLTKVLLVNVLGKFRRLYPNIKISIVNGLTSDLIYQLNTGKLDFVIFNEGNVEEKNVELEVLTKMEYAFIYNSDIVDKIEIKNLEELNKYPLILQKKTSNTRKFLDSYMNQMQIKLIPQLEVVSQDLICDFVRCGLGIGFVLSKLQERNYSELCKIDINEKITTDVYIATNKLLNPTFAAQTFLEMLRAEV